jgi:hypothetical protein
MHQGEFPYRAAAIGEAPGNSFHLSAGGAGLLPALPPRTFFDWVDMNLMATLTARVRPSHLRKLRLGA